jgi:hypothetical protein
VARCMKERIVGGEGQRRDLAAVPLGMQGPAKPSQEVATLCAGLTKSGIALLFLVVPVDLAKNDEAGDHRPSVPSKEADDRCQTNRDRRPENTSYYGDLGAGIMSWRTIRIAQRSIYQPNDGRKDSQGDSTTFQ